MNNLIRLLSFLKPYRARFTVSTVLATLSITADLLIPMIFGWMISRGVESGELRQVALFAGLLVLAQAVRSVINYLQWTVQHQVGQNVVRDVRNQIYARLQALPTSFLP